MNKNCVYWDDIRKEIEENIQIKIVKAEIMKVKGLTKFVKLRYGHFVSPTMVTMNSRYITRETKNLEDGSVILGEKDGIPYITFKDNKLDIEETVEKKDIGVLE